MITSDIILGFQEYVDDTTGLSSTQELALANKIYRKILDMKPWEFLKTPFVGSTTSQTVNADGSSSITLPANFKMMLENYGYSDNVTAQGGKVVFVGPNLDVYKVVNWSDRLQYRADRTACYLDMKNSLLVFPIAPVSGLQVLFDYIYRPDDLTLATSPVFPSEYHPMVYHGMATEDYIIQQFDKAKSYAAENRAMYTEYGAAMGMWNSNLVTINM